MKIGIGSDGQGYELKARLVEALQRRGFDVYDVGTDSSAPADYCDYAVKVARGVVDGVYDRGILICGTGQGMAITANKVPGVRAALCYDVFSAVMSREHNNANVLCTGAWMVDYQQFEKVALIWLGGVYECGRHQRRLDKIAAIEAEEISS
ncbi:MAG: ribose 5-phosphate isomerase B [Bacillota bacterium]